MGKIITADEARKNSLMNDPLYQKMSDDDTMDKIMEVIQKEMEKGNNSVILDFFIQYDYVLFLKDCGYTMTETDIMLGNGYYLIEW